MGQAVVRRTQAQRTEGTRAALVTAGRELFVTEGYAATSTPAIVARAGVTRGALYHHFPGKRALFRAVVEAEASAVAVAIEQASSEGTTPERALRDGSRAYLKAMRAAGRTRLLLVDGPAVLGGDETDAIDLQHARRTLREGLTALAVDVPASVGEAGVAPVEELAELLSAAFDAAAVAIEAGAEAAAYERALDFLLSSVVRSLASPA